MMLGMRHLSNCEKIYANKYEHALERALVVVVPVAGEGICG